MKSKAAPNKNLRAQNLAKKTFKFVDYEYLFTDLLIRKNICSMNSFVELEPTYLLKKLFLSKLDTCADMKIWFCVVISNHIGCKHKNQTHQKVPHCQINC